MKVDTHGELWYSDITIEDARLRASPTDGAFGDAKNREARLLPLNRRGGSWRAFLRQEVWRMDSEHLLEGRREVLSVSLPTPLMAATRERAATLGM